MVAATHHEVLLSGLRHRVSHWAGPQDNAAFLLLHGWLDQGSSLSELAEGLSALGEVFVLDFRGHGHSEWIGRGGYYHFFDYLRDLEELLLRPLQGPLGALHRSPIWLVGHSMGGAVATLAAGALPERIRGLVLLEGSGPPALPASAALRRSQRWLQDLKRFGEGPRYSDSSERLKARLASLYPRFDAALLERFASEAMVHEEGKGWRWRYDPLHRCTNPLPFQQEIYIRFASAYPGAVLQIYGEASPLARRDDPQVQAREAAFSGVRTQVGIPDAGHMMHLSHAQPCLRAIRSWIAGQQGDLA